MNALHRFKTEIKSVENDKNKKPFKVWGHLKHFYLKETFETEKKLHIDEKRFKISILKNSEKRSQHHQQWLCSNK